MSRSYRSYYDPLATPLHLAIKDGCETLDDDILSDHIDTPDGKGMLPIHLASMIGSSAIVEKLLNHGASVDSFTKTKLTPLHLAAESGNDEVIKFLLSEGCKVNRNDNYKNSTPLHLAVSKGLLGTVRLLLMRRANVDAADIDDKTALHMAVAGEFRDTYEIVKLLLDFDADANAEDSDGMTPLYFSSDENVSELLISEGVNVNAKSNTGMSPLHRAIEDDCDENIKVLLKHGADVNCRDSRGATPLCYAAHIGRHDIAESLLTNGARIDDEMTDGSAPLHLAIRNAHARVVSLLLKYGATVDSRAVAATAIRRSRYGFDREDSSPDGVISSIEQHFVSIKVLNPGTREPALPWLDLDSARIRDFRRSCENEAERMGRERIGDTCVSLRDVLTKSAHVVAKYASNPSVVEAMMSRYYGDKFPIYRDRIARKFKNAREREKLSKPSERALSFLIGRDLPDVVIDEILSNFSDLDLKLMTEAFPEAAREKLLS